MKLSFYCLLFLFVFELSAQDCETEKALVNAPSGLILRKQVAKGYINTIPFGDTVLFCSKKSYGRAEYEGTKGDWRKVYIADQIGYMFDGFLKPILQDSAALKSLDTISPKPSAESDSLLVQESPKLKAISLHPNLKSDRLQLAIESYNFCGDIQSLDPSLYWYGLFLDDENKPDGLHSIKPLDLKLILSKEKVGKGLEFDILTDQEQRSLFLLGSEKIIPYQDITLYDQSEAMRVRGSKLFPGQQLYLDQEQKVSLTATGQVLKAGDCPVLKDYQIVINYQNEGKKIEQNLAELIPNYGECQIPRIYWYGDLSGDGLSDIIFVSVFEDKNVFTFLQSVPNPKAALFTTKAVFTLTNCQ